MYQQLIGLASALLQEDTTDYKGIYNKAYNQTYRAEAQRYSFADRKVVAEINIARVKEDLILSNLEVQRRQKDAEAAARVSAAAAGVAGGSVESVLYQTHVNAAQAVADNMRKADQASADLATEVMSASLGANSVKNPEHSVGKGRGIGDYLMQGFSSFSLQDVRDMNDLWDQWNSPTTDFGGGIAVGEAWL